MNKLYKYNILDVLVALGYEVNFLIVKTCETLWKSNDMHLILGTALPDRHNKPWIKFSSWYTEHGVWVQQTPILKHCISAISSSVSAIILIYSFLPAHMSSAA